MSFAVDAKREVLKTEIKNDCCALAFLSAMIKGSGQLTLTNGKNQINIFTEIQDLFDVVNNIIKQYYDEECTLALEEENLGFKIIKYKIIIAFSDKIL